MTNAAIAYMGGAGKWGGFILDVDKLTQIVVGVSYTEAQVIVASHMSILEHGVSRGLKGVGGDYRIMPGIMLLPKYYPIPRTPALLHDCAYQIGSTHMYIWHNRRLVSIDISSEFDPLCTASIATTDAGGNILYGVRGSEWATDNQDRKLKVTAQYWAAWIDEVLTK